MKKDVCEKILQSIKSNDLVSFSSSIEGNENISFGRFPILSLCYLYNAKKIIRKFERKLLGIDKYKVVSEDFDIYKKFRTVAGRTLRLYLNGQTISPLEMLAILHKDSRVKRKYKIAKKNECVVDNLKLIYHIHAQQIELYTSIIKISPRRYSSGDLRTRNTAIIFSASIMIILTLAYFITGMVVGMGTSWSYFSIGSQTQLIKALNANGSYQLRSDITIDNLSSVNSFSGSIDGNGHTIYIENIDFSNIIEENKGAIKNLNIVYKELDLEISNSLSLLLGKNNGVIENVSITCNNLTITCNKSKDNDIFINGFAGVNNGTILDCSLSINLDIESTGQGECYIGGFVGENNKIIKNCIVENGSSISTIESDVAGIVFNNGSEGKISDCKNYATILQNSSTDIWSPNVGGITLNNYGLIENSYNYGSLQVIDTCNSTNTSGIAFVGGIVAMNHRDIVACYNWGDLIANTDSKLIYSGGIASYTDIYTDSSGNSYIPSIKQCGVESTINVSSKNEKAFIFAGGICGYIYGEIIDNYSLVTFTNGNNTEKMFIGTAIGSAYLQYQIFNKIICIDASGVYVADRDNVLFQIGALINNGTIVSTGLDMPDNGIITTNDSTIKSRENYKNA